jgi:hypothetical protein
MSKYLKVTLADEQRQELEALIHAGNAPGRTQSRARILLLSDTSIGYCIKLSIEIIYCYGIQFAPKLDWQRTSL